MSTDSTLRNLPTEPFFMIYGMGHGAPTARHDTRDLAEAEAKRLARLNPGAVFVVLEAVSAIVKREFDIATFRSAASLNDEVPF